ncbi:hypothetical protein [Fusibacter bizertensis]
MKSSWIEKAIRIIAIISLVIAGIIVLLGGMINKEYGGVAGSFLAIPFIVSGIFAFGFYRIIDLLNQINENQKRMINITKGTYVKKDSYID